VSFAPGVLPEWDSIGYNASKIPAVNNELSWGELFNSQMARQRVAMFRQSIWLGMLNARHGHARGLGLLNPVDISNMTEKEVDTVCRLPEGGRRRKATSAPCGKAYGELVNLMASEEVWIAGRLVAGDRPRSSSKGHPGALRPSPRKATVPGATATAISAEAKKSRPLLRMAELLDRRLSPAPAKSEIGYFSTYGQPTRSYLDPKLVKQVYGGEGRDGGSLADRAQGASFVWNTRAPRTSSTIPRSGNEFSGGLIPRHGSLTATHLQPEGCHGSRTQGQEGCRHRRQQGHRSRQSPRAFARRGRRCCPICARANTQDVCGGRSHR